MNTDPAGRDATSDAPRFAGPPPAGRERTGLLVSCAVIVLWWIGFAAWKLSRPDHPLPDSISGLFLRKLIEAVVITAVTGLLLKASGETFADLGLRFRNVGRSILLGLGFALVLFVVINVGLNPVLGGLLGGQADSAVRTLFRDPSQAGWWVATAIVGGGYAEELVRVFVLTRFARLWGTPGLVIALVVDCVVFGLGHLYQGTTGAVSAGLTGFLLALVFLRRRRATDAMATHAWFDLLGIAAAYMLYARRG
jgi:membrane protease YdiL (CAAX protease family)